MRQHFILNIFLCILHRIKLSISYIFNELEVPEIKAITNKENVSSQGLLLKLGFKLKGTIELPNESDELLLYKIES